MITKRIGFTGARAGMTERQKLRLREFLSQLFWEGGAVYFHHGDCVGADAEAHDIATAIGYETVGHPCFLKEQRAFRQTTHSRLPKSPLERNRDIVDEVDFMIACPKGPETLRSGTWATVRYAKRVGRKGEIIWP